MPIEDLLPTPRPRERIGAVIRADRAATGDAEPTAATCSRSSATSHVARKVVGVGSVGTRCWIVLLLGRDDADPLFLQAKEAQAVGARARSRPERLRQPRRSGWSRASG